MDVPRPDGAPEGTAGTSPAPAGVPGTDAPTLTVGMPIFNEAAQLEDSLSKLVPALERLGITFEIVLVDDGSRDATPQIVDRLAAADPRLRAIHHPVNLGVGAGIATAMRSARGEFFILIPADLALDLKDLSKYVDASRHADIVAGYTGTRSDYSTYRNVVSRINSTMIGLLFGVWVRNPNYIHLYRTSLLRDITLESTGSAMLFGEVLAKAHRRGARIVQVPIRYVPRAGGKATGAKASLIVATAKDMLRLWWRSVTGKL